MRDIIFTKFLFRVVLFAGTNISIFCVILIPFLNSANYSATQISYLFLFKKVARVLSDIPLGAFFDKYGGRIVLISSRVMKVFSLFLILKYSYSFNILLVALFFDGLAESAIFNKSEVFVYNHFSKRNKITGENYSKILSIFYFSVDSIYTLSGFLGSYLYMKTGRYDLILILSIIYLSISMFLIFGLEDNRNKIDSKVTIFGNLKNISSFIKNSTFDYKKHGIMLSLISFLTWDITMILGIFLSKNHINPEKIGFMQSLFSMCLSIGCLLPLLIRMKNFGQIISSFFLVNFFIILVAIWKNYLIVLILVSFLPLIFTMSEAFLLNYLDANISRDIRATGIAVFTTLEALFKICGTLLFAKFSEKFNETYGVLAFSSVSIVFLFYFVFKKNLGFIKKKLAF